MAKQRSPMDEYLASVSKEQRAVLDKLRKTIQAAVPDAVEGVSYGLPAFLLQGKAVAAISASARHCSLFPMSGKVVASLAKDLAGYDTSKGTIRFTLDKPLPAALVRKVVKARLTEIKDKQQTKSKSSRFDPAVTAFLKELDHPLKKQIDTLRKVILDVHPAIQEGIKWNSVSFRTSEYFATVNLRSRDVVQLVFHRGAKKRDDLKDGIKIDDPQGMLRWLANDRCLVTVKNNKGLAVIIKQWLPYV